MLSDSQDDDSAPLSGLRQHPLVASALIVVICVTTSTTQKQIQKRSGLVEGQGAMVQKLLLYGMPVSLFVSGFFFPIGVLIY